MKTADKTSRRVIILDTSAFIAGLDPFSISEQLFTAPVISRELREKSMAGFRFKTAVESGKLEIRRPETRFLEEIKESATLVGDSFFLSETDLQVLALALELKAQGYSPMVATDDYSMQNVANQAGIEFAPLGTFGIRSRLRWLRYCPACHREYPADYRSRSCRVCGTQLKRKPIRKTGLQNRSGEQMNEPR
jgi:UPF0271 protein